MTPGGPRRRWLSHDRRVLLLTLASGAPAVAAALGFLWAGGHSSRVAWTAALAITVCWIGLAFAVRRRVVYPLQTLANLLAGLREGDASLRARGATHDDALGEVMIEANTLAATIGGQRLDAREATALLRRVMAEIDVAVFAFDAEGRAKLVNRAGERLLGRPAERILNAGASDLGLAACLDNEPFPPPPMVFPGGAGRWEVRRSGFRLGGLPHQLLVLTDVSRSLRDEERKAWQRLMRVLGHEINNSLAPIKSIAASLSTILSRECPEAEWREDMRRGLDIVAGRAEALGRFTASYSRLARLPEPRLEPLSIGPLVRRVAGLETRLPVACDGGPEAWVRADPDQIEQLLINLVRNAVEASLETSGRVTARWARAGAEVEVSIEDEGPGLAQTANLFVPFFTTKPGGSGIGLVLSRQIAETHGGSLTLEDRATRGGCVARLRLPALNR